MVRFWHCFAKPIERPPAALSNRLVWVEMNFHMKHPQCSKIIEYSHPKIRQVLSTNIQIFAEKNFRGVSCVRYFWRFLNTVQGTEKKVVKEQLHHEKI